MKLPRAFMVGAMLFGVALATGRLRAAMSNPHSLPLFPPALTPTAGSSAHALTVPADTLASVRLLSGIHSGVTHSDDTVEAQLVDPVYVDGRVALPAGSLLTGRVTAVRPAGRLHRSGELAFRFDQISLPDGQEAPIQAVLAGLSGPATRQLRLDEEGDLKARGGISWKAIAGGLIGFGAFGAVKVAAASAATLSGLLPAASGAIVAYELLWPRGNEVHLPPQTPAEVRLDFPLTVRVSW